MRGYGYNTEQAAARLGVSPELVTIKLLSMQQRGLDIPGVIIPENNLFEKAAE